MRIGVYGLAKNNADTADRWADSTTGADVVVVTDTGSSDGTIAALRAHGITVVESRILPWRWDVAHTQSLNNLPGDVDICVRLDLDEVLVPGWRSLVEAAWREGTTKLRHRYEWGPGVQFDLDRFHCRDGYRWTGATHEGLVRWVGEERTVVVPDLLIVQAAREREPGRRESDTALLRTACAETPDDARMRWYLARELDYAGLQEEAAAEYKRFLALPGGWSTERAHACRQLSLLDPGEARHWLMRAFIQAPAEPEAACRLAYDCRDKGDPAGALYWGSLAIQARPEARTHASEMEAYGPTPWVWTAEAAIGCRRFDDAGRIARDGLRRFPGHERLAAIAADFSPTDGPER